MSDGPSKRAVNIWFFNGLPSKFVVEKEAAEQAEKAAKRERRKKARRGKKP
jgi:hypothetical protein